MSLLDRIKEHALDRPKQVAIRGESIDLSYAELAAEVDRIGGRLIDSGLHTLGLVMDNGPAWAVLDLAALESGLCVVPLPRFFSTRQARHAVREAGVQAIITDDAPALRAWLGDAVYSATGTATEVAGRNLAWVPATGNGASVPDGIHKVTFTSGTTGEPKGVMLSWSHIRPVVESLVETAEVDSGDRHLALTPLAVLLENIGGIYAPLWAGATSVLIPLPKVGLSGSSSLDTGAMGRQLHEQQATSAILTPQSLRSLVEWIEEGNDIPRSLRFAAVGGASVSPRLLERAIDLGLPVFEGYGLSECASVVSLNAPGGYRVGSVGRPLPHLRVQITPGGEVLIGGPGFAGYLGEPPPVADWWRTGDLGWLDGDGFLHLSGRRRDVFITAFGRNLAPEWVERELCIEPAIAQAAVFGEARPWLAAIILPKPGAGNGDVAAALARVNAGLPDYARIRQWIPARESFTPRNECLTGTGRLRREVIHDLYKDQLQSLYIEEDVS